MIYGNSGTGKTVGALSIVASHPNDTFYYLEADRILDTAMEMFPEQSWDNLWRLPAFRYNDFIKSMGEVIEYVKAATNPKTQWVISDTIGHCYREIQNMWSLRINKKPLEQLQQERAGQKEYFDGIHGLKEWPFIKNTFYNEFLWPMIRYYGNNAVLIAHSRSTDTRFSPQAPTEYTDLFKQLGQLPDVHKDVINYVNTCLYFSNTDGFQYRTLKESGRRKWINIEKPITFSDFWQSYMSEVMM
jgi:hypothetical protein